MRPGLVRGRHLRIQLTLGKLSKVLKSLTQCLHRRCNFCSLKVICPEGVPPLVWLFRS